MLFVQGVGSGQSAAESRLIDMKSDLRRVWVIQDKATGMFLHLELYLVRSLKLAGRAPDPLCAKETAEMNLNGPYEIHSFYEPFEDQ